MKTAWKVFCRNSTISYAKALPGFLVKYSCRKTFSVQWSNWKLAIVVLFSAGLVISWISKLIQTPLQLKQRRWRECMSRGMISLRQRWNNQLTVDADRMPLIANTLEAKGDSRAGNWLTSCCTGLSQGYTYQSRDSLQTFKVWYESYNWQTARSRGTFFF